MHNFKTFITLSEASLSDIRSNMIAAINDANGKDLVTMYRAMESSVEKRLIKNKLIALFKDRGLGAFVNKTPFDQFFKKIVNTKATVEQKEQFLDGLIEGSFFNSSAFVKSKSGKLKSLINTSNPVMSELLDWMFVWAPQIDKNSTVAVGSAEALLIFLSKSGGKGDPFGDVKIGKSVIEVKASSGALGKDGPKYWGNSRDSFIAAVKKVIPGLASKSNVELAKMNPLGHTKQKEKSVALNTLSALMSSAGKSDTEIASFWKAFIDGALGVSLSGKILVNKGVVDYNSWMRYATAAALDEYIRQTKFEVLTLLDVNTGEYLNFTSGNEMLSTDGWHFDQSLTWTGGGQGKSLSPRVYMGSKTFPTYQSNDHIKAIDTQYKDVVKVANAISRRAKNAERLLKALRFDPKVEHQVKITKQLKNPEVRKIVMMKSKDEIEKYWKQVSR